MKLSLYVFFLFPTLSYASDCNSPPIWIVDKPQWSLITQWDKNNFKRNHFGGTVYGVNYKTKIDIVKMNECYVPKIRLTTWDDITIRLNEMIKGNTCYEKHVLEHEKLHQEYAIKRRNHWLQYLNEESQWSQKLKSTKKPLSIQEYHTEVGKILEIVIKTKGLEDDIALDANNPGRDVINKCGQL